MANKKTLIHTLQEKEFDHDYNNQHIAIEETEKIDDAINEIITEETKEFYQEAPTDNELSEAIQSSTPENSVLAYGIQTKDEIAQNISERVKRKLSEKVKENITELTTFEEIDNYIKEQETAGDFVSFINSQTKKVKVEPKLLFSYITKTLKEEQKEELEKQFENFAFLLARAKAQNGIALKETAERRIVEIEREMKASSVGYKQYFLLEHINTLKKLIPNNVLHFCQLQEFPRAIPNEPLAKLKEAEKHKIFSEIWILYLDYTKEEIKSTATKIREKDPIMFGKILSNSKKLFIITDWVDEYCDLTIEKAVKLLKNDNANFALPSYNCVSPKEVQEMFDEVKRKDEVVKSTNVNNWRSNYANEIKKPNGTLSFFQKFYKFFK